MRPRGRGDDDDDESSLQRSAPEAEPEPAQPPPPQPARAPLSSLVVRPPPQENGASSPAAATARSSSSPAGYGMHAGPSPPRQRRLESGNFDDAIGPRYTHGYQGSGRGGARFRDGTPPYGRGCRSFGRGYNAPGKEFINIDGEYVHRNDPNLSPREGDWLCQNPNCGNLNFARRTHCNNCNMYRYESRRSPHRGYFNSPPPGPPRILGPPSSRAPPREMGRYRSPPRGWGVGDPRGYAGRSPPDRAGRFPDPLQKERMGFRGDRDLRDRVKFEWSAAEEYNQRERPHDGLYLDRSRGRSGSPRGNWGHNMRDRSRSPAGNRPVKSSFTGRGRPDLDYASTYVSRGRPNNLDAGHGRGRGYRPVGDPYPGEGRCDRRSAPHGRSEGRY